MKGRLLGMSRATFASLSVRNYRLYFVGQAISQSGTWMQTVALGWLALTLTHSGTQLGFIVALQFLPLLLFGSWGGVIVDRLDKRHLLIWAQGAYGVLALILSVIVFADAVTLWMLYAFSLGLGLVRVFDNPLRQSFVSEMVGPEHLKNAVSLNSTSNNLMRAVGPMFGGIFIAAAGVGLCFLVNALSYATVIWMLHSMRENELHLSPPAPKGRGQIREGLRYVWSTPSIRDTLLLIAVAGIFAYEFQVSLPLLADYFGTGAGGYAALMAAFGLGSTAGGLYAAGRRSASPSDLVFFTFLFGLGLITASLSGDFAAALFSIFLVGVFSINLTSLANTTIQLESLPSMRGRVMALWSIAMVGSTPIGGPIIGWVGEYAGARWSLALGGIATLLALAVYNLLRGPETEKPIPEKIRIEEEEARIASSKE